MTLIGRQTQREYFRGMFEYEDWANAQVLHYLETGPADRRLLDIFGHLIADAVPWLCLLRGEPVPEALDCSPRWSAGECRVHLLAGQERREQFLGRLAEEDYDTVVLSPGPAGRLFSNTVGEILTHLLSHGLHHRGQIEWLIEQEAGTYLPTSYMPYLRWRASPG